MEFLGFPTLSSFFLPFSKCSVPPQDSPNRAKDCLQCTQVHKMVSTQIQQILTSHITPHHGVRRPYLMYFAIAQWLVSLADFYHETSQWRQTLSLPALKNWAVFLFHSKVPPESVLEKKQHWYTNFPVISARTQCHTVHKTEAAFGHQQARKPL